MRKAAADELLAVYACELGCPVAHLTLWELAAVPQPMHGPDWLAVVRKELREFIVNIQIF